MNSDFAAVKRFASRLCYKHRLSHITGEDLVEITLHSLLDGSKKWYYRAHPHFSWSVMRIMRFTALEQRANIHVARGLTPYSEIDIEGIAEEDAGTVLQFATLAKQELELEEESRACLLKLCEGDAICHKVAVYCLDNPRGSSQAGNMVMRPREISDTLGLSKTEVRNAVKRLRRIYAHLASGNLKTSGGLK